jgi:hypothetical protein
LLLLLSKGMRIGNDKTVYSKFQIVSLVDFDINISVALSHVINIWSVLYTLLTLHLLSYMSIIMGAVVDPPFNRVYQYNQQFRLRIADIQTRTINLFIFEGLICEMQ